jgi:hypothetical protein
VAFSGSGSDSAAGATYSFGFGDGSPDVSGLLPAGAAPVSTSHPYRILGSADQTFTATFTVSDGSYARSSSVPVTVTAAGVSAYITLPVTNMAVLPGADVPFNAAATSQNTASGAFTYAWAFGDGASAQGASVTHPFKENGPNLYLVTLTAKDATGATGTATVAIGADTSFVMDVNGDGSIDVRDLLALSVAWGSPRAMGSGPAGPGKFNGLNLYADLNGDGAVNDEDIALWVQTFPSVNP